MDASPKSYCPVCCSLSASVVDRRLLSRGIHRNVICGSCGMVWSSPRPSPSVYADFYRREYTQEVYGLDGSAKSIRHVMAWRRKRSRQKIGYFPDFWKRGQRVLEIGAGVGAFLDVLKRERGATVYGIEPAPTFVDFAATHFGLRLHRGSYESWRNRRPSGFPKKFDRIVMDQILEHILEPLPFLESLHPLLASGGELFISVPNIAAPKEPKKVFFIFEHVSSFSPFALCLLLIRSGFKPTRMKAEKPGSLQITAAPMSSSQPMLDPSKWGTPLTVREINKGFTRL